MKSHLVVALLAVAGWLMGQNLARAQLIVQIQEPRVNYLLFEPIVLKITVINNGAVPVPLSDVRGESWLRFLVKEEGGMRVRPARDFYQQPITLQPGDRVDFGFDITPNYLIRAVGTYFVTALVRLPEGRGDLASNQVEFSVVEGQVVWSQILGMPSGEKRHFKLIQHLVENSMKVFALVESPELNRVFCNRLLGSLMAGEKPQCEIEGREAWHILFRLSGSQYRHVKMTLDGQTESAEDFAFVGKRPSLRNVSGQIEVVGLMKAEEADAEALSAIQPPEVLSR